MLSTHLKPFKSASIVSAMQFSREQVEAYISLATIMKQLDEAAANDNDDDTNANSNSTKVSETLRRVLAGKILVPLFFENSTRTYMSFGAAMQKLGGNVLPLPLEASSMSKGETLEDTIRAVSCYSNVICLRHPNEEAMSRACSVTSLPVLNCGNGAGEHPSQSLLDVFTIKLELGTIDGLNIALLGDLKNGRTVHSLAKLLSLFKLNTLWLIAPKLLAMPDEVIEYVRGRGVTVEVADAPTEDLMKQLDVLYVTRIQKERFTSHEEYLATKGTYIVDAGLLAHAKPAGKMVVMHPLPRVDEISTDIDEDPRAAYFRQMKNGVHMRMAMLTAAFGKVNLFE